MIPVLYYSHETDFKNNGIGMMSDCISCDVTEDSEGLFELSMVYPLNGKRFNDLYLEGIIKSKANKFSDPQLFRIYGISKPMEDFATVSAHHISYDLSGIPVAPFEAHSIAEAVSMLNENAIVPSRFKIKTDIDLLCDFKLKIPQSTRSVIFEIAKICGAEIEFDNFEVNLLKSRGVDRGFSVRYGKNMQSLVQDELCSNVVNGIIPYWYDDKTDILVMPKSPVYITQNETNAKIISVDFTKEFETQPTVEELLHFTEQYIISSDVGKPEVSLDVSFVTTTIDNVFLFDLVTTVFPKLKVNTKAKVNKVVYDVLLDKVKSVSIGTVKRSLINQ